MGFKMAAAKHAVVDSSLIHAESTLTDRFQTTIPELVRKKLGLSKRDKISYDLTSDGRIVLTRALVDEGDLVMSAFLGFLAKDIQTNPQNVTGLTPELSSRISTLVAGVEIDLDAPLSDDNE